MSEKQAMPELGRKVRHREKPHLVGRVIGINTTLDEPVMVAWWMRHKPEDLEIVEDGDA